MWSSPLLLLVLVFTLNSRPLHVEPTTSSGPSTTTTSRATSSTTTTPSITMPAGRFGPEPKKGAKSTEVTTTTAAIVTSVSMTDPKSTTTTQPRVATRPSPRANSSASTTTSVAASEVLGALEASGQLTLAQPNAVLPLRGPGHWVLLSSHEVTRTLQCGSRSVALSERIVIATNQRCLLNVAVQKEAPTSWTLRTDR